VEKELGKDGLEMEEVGKEEVERELGKEEVEIGLELEKPEPREMVGKLEPPREVEPREVEPREELEKLLSLEELELEWDHLFWLFWPLEVPENCTLVAGPVETLPVKAVTGACVRAGREVLAWGAPPPMAMAMAESREGARELSTCSMMESGALRRRGSLRGAARTTPVQASTYSSLDMAPVCG